MGFIGPHALFMVALPPNLGTEIFAGEIALRGKPGLRAQRIPIEPILFVAENLHPKMVQNSTRRATR